MKPIRTANRCLFFKAALLVVVGQAAATAPVYAGANDPLQLIYAFPGVRDDGGVAGAGVASVVHCYNFNSTPEKLQFVVQQFDGTVKANLSFNLPSNNMRTATTHDTNVYEEDLVLHTGAIAQGVLGVLSTSVNVVCTAATVDAAATVPNGIDLHPTRFNPMPGTVE